MTKIGFDRELRLRTTIMFVFLIWPLFVFGRPDYFEDSLSYHRGGAFAASYLVDAVSPDSDEPAAGLGGTIGPSSTGEVKGARSIPYSVAVYLLAGPGRAMVPLVLMQSAMIAFMVALLGHILDIRSRRRFLAAGVFVSVTTPLSVFTNYVIPDIFAAVVIIAAVISALENGRLARSLLMALLLLSSFAIMVHASHVPLALGLMPVVFGLRLLFGPGRPWRTHVRLAGLLLVPLLISAAVTVAGSMIGFGEASLASKRFPLTLARSIEDGPARWYLQAECRRPRYAICEVFGTDIPKSVPAVLWGVDGLDGRASPSQLDRIRQEEPEIVLRAAQRYPSAQAAGTVANIARQMISFGLANNSFDRAIVTTEAGDLVFEDRQSQGNRQRLDLLTGLTILSAALGLCGILFSLYRAPGPVRVAILIMLSGLILNALICAVFSGVADRYQARVIWLLPLFALFTWPAVRVPRWGRSESS